jgi:hypothetical protein
MAVRVLGAGERLTEATHSAAIRLQRMTGVLVCAGVENSDWALMHSHLRAVSLGVGAGRLE